ncbi:MAG TPA: hypothetical protein ENN44_03745 [Methanoculleus sp.]|nr:hypothetical protein [Methanoculleus sp.]
MRRRSDGAGGISAPVTTLFAGPVRHHGTLVVIPVVRRVRWAASPGYAVAGEPLGLLLYEEGGAEMRIIPFCDTRSWWAPFCAAYPAFAGVVLQTPAGEDGDGAGKGPGSACSF